MSPQGFMKQGNILLSVPCVAVGWWSPMTVFLTQEPAMMTDQADIDSFLSRELDRAYYHVTTIVPLQK